MMFEETLYLRDDEADEFGDSGTFSDSLDEDYEEEEEEEEAEVPSISGDLEPEPPERSYSDCRGSYMSDAQIGPIVLILLVLLAGAHLLGYLFAKLHQPRVIGEIAAGMLLGPMFLGRIAPRLTGAISSGSNAAGE